MKDHGEGRSRETPLGPGAKKDGCFRRLRQHGILEYYIMPYLSILLVIVYTLTNREAQGAFH